MARQGEGVDMTIFEYRDRRPGWLLAKMQYELACQIDDMHMKWISGELYYFERNIVRKVVCINLSLLAAIAPFDARSERKKINATWARIEREFKETGHV
jgi:hypothetical protein